MGVVYDDDGNRVSETAGSTTTQGLIDTLNPTGYSQVLDELVSGSVTKTYTLAGLAASGRVSVWITFPDIIAREWEDV
ncbi:MAG: hypothetical protein WBQ03_11400 [Candidatus Sulfotelmatobacter sp.]